VIETRSDREPDHTRLYRQPRGSFATIYLTLLSIIQGVALADLASVVSSGYEHFTVVQWLLVPMNFFSISNVWNHFMADSISMEWIPRFSDAVLPFTFGAVELLLNHALLLGLAVWLIGMAAAALEAGGAWFMDRKAAQETRDTHLVSLFRSRVPGYLRHGWPGWLSSSSWPCCTHSLRVEGLGIPGAALDPLALGVLVVFGWGGIAKVNTL